MTEISSPGRPVRPNQADVDALRDLLDLMEDFSSNDQRARYLLTCDWMRERGARAAAHAAEMLAEVQSRKGLASS